MESDVKVASITSTGTVFAARARVRHIAFRSTGTEGTVVLKDGGASGTTLITLNTPAAVGFHEFSLPGRGVLFGTDIHGTLTSVDGLMVVYEG